MNLAFTYNSRILAPAIVNGIAISSLYGVLVISLVLVHRINKSVAFVQGGIATVGGFLYWYFTAKQDFSATGVSTKGWPKTPALIGVVLIGVVIGLAYGAIVTNRMGNYPRVTVTTFGLGVMLLSVGIMTSIWKGVFETGVKGPFVGTFKVFGQYVTYHQAFTLVVLFVVVAALSFVMRFTRAGIYVRAIADDTEAATMMGIRVTRVGTLVWGVAGGLGALSGALIVSMTVLHDTALIFVLMRALAAAVLGGFDSFALGIVGAMMFGVIESVIGGGVFGTVNSGTREVILTGALLGAVLVIANFGRRKIATMAIGEG
jgi:branched-chain amino acid transport system permease protein